ncbi:MAG TPA: UvrD-helicase domain-containing protein [bacterium]|nr:UvrD-helicase domain-containing protein [bacterium]
MADNVTGKPLRDVIYRPDFPLGGVNLIEASAGTGKTYSIQSLYLRLAAVEGLAVDRILVVTFTEAATRELRDRLRGILEKGRIFLEGNLDPGDPDRERIERILGLPAAGVSGSDEEERSRRGRRLRSALLNYDAAAISTIHGFCNRILQEYAFESGQEFRIELSGDPRGTVEDLCRDWWRAHVLDATDRERAVLGAMALEGLVAAALKRISKPYARLLPTPGPAVFPAAEYEAMLAAWSEPEVRAALREGKVRKSAVSEAVFGFIEGLAGGNPFPVAPGDDRLLEKMTRTHLETRLNLGSPGLPPHPFFDRCRTFVEALAAARLSAPAAAVEEVAERFHSRRDDRITYDELLLRFLRALENPVSGSALVSALRGGFQAALIDEFQDTDPVQYRIFRRIFFGGERPVFLVGDPKQAIYSFRNGDIHTYYAAARSVPENRRYRLDVNHRSEPALVDAVNLLFRDSSRRRAFINPELPFAGEVKAAPRREAPFLEIGGKPDERPFRIWYYPDWADSGRGKAPGESSARARRLYADVASEAARLLADPAVALGGRPLAPSDMAVLVRTHREADLIADAFLRRGIPTVQQNTGSVFDSPEAVDFHLLLKGLADPGDIRSLRSLPAADIFFGGAAQVSALLAGTDVRSPVTGRPVSLAGIKELLEEARKRWRSSSFIAGFNFFARETGMRAHLLGRRRGERALTNLLHLAELGQAACAESGLGPEGLVRWLESRRAFPAPWEDDIEIRLESDSRAVKIMTVFKSKGLQFPVVFVPTLWRPARADRSPVREYHRPPAAGSDPSAVLDFDRDGPGKEAAAAELREESVRLLYVALTRGINRTYLAWGDIREDSGPLGHILGTDPREAWSAADSPIHVEEKRGGETDLPPVAVRAGGEADGGPLLTADRGNPLLRPRFDAAWGHSSFSDLHPAAPSFPGASADSRDYDAGGEAREAGGEEEGEKTIFDFPAGARTGECWHSILETVDFAVGDEALLAAVSNGLDRYRLSGTEAERETRCRSVAGMIRSVLTTPLDAHGEIVLERIPRRDRVSEMEFDFPLASRKRIFTSEWRNILGTYWGEDPRKRIFTEALEGWNRLIPRGFMTGYIDLIFRRGGKFYLVDWKSNRLNGQPVGFAPEGLRREMAERGYAVQYLLYTVALNAHLLDTVPGYEYETGFGGIFYVFLRGVDGTPGRGIYADRPAAGLIGELSDLLLEGGGA